MTRSLVDWALNARYIVLSLALLLFGAGVIAFKALPVEAYPDVANTWVQVITQWPGRAAEEVEQQITVPIEIQGTAFRTFSMCAPLRSPGYRLSI